jgi:predicted nucleic acid-binding protein
MAVYFLDANVVVKHYHVEKGTPRVDAILAEPGARHVISRLCVTEVVSALARKVREGVLTQVAYDLARRQVLKDVAAKKYEVVDVTTLEFNRADDLISKYVLNPGSGRLMRCNWRW